MLKLEPLEEEPVLKELPEEMEEPPEELPKELPELLEGRLL